MNVEQAHHSDLAVLMITGPSDGASGIGDYTDELMDPMSSFRFKTVALPVESKNPVQYLQPLRHLLNDDFDIVHVQHEYGMFGPFSVMTWLFFPCLYFLCWTLNTSVVLTIHEGLNKDLVTGSQRWLKQPYIELMNQCIALNADHIIFLSKDTKRRFTASVDVQSDSVLPHGVNTSRSVELSQTEAKQLFGYDPEDIVISEPGYVEPRKGTERLVDLAKRLSDFDFLIAGGASGDAYEDYYERIKRRAPDNLRMTGHLSETEFHAAFLASDLVLLPYQTVEQQSVINKLNQSGIFNRCAAYRTPVIAADLEYFSLLKKNWCCVQTLNFDDIDSTANTIEQLLNDKTERERMTENLSKYAEAHSFEKVAEEHIALYRRIASKNSGNS